MSLFSSSGRYLTGATTLISHTLTKRSNVQATCLITILDANYGWINTEEGEWIYDPEASTVRLPTDLDACFNHSLGPCIEEDRRNTIDALTTSSDDPVTLDDDVKYALDRMLWPADGKDTRGKTQLIGRFPFTEEYIAGPVWSSGYHLGNGFVVTAGHSLISYLKQNTLSNLKVVFGWYGDVRGKRFKVSEIFSIDK